MFIVALILMAIAVVLIVIGVTKKNVLFKLIGGVVAIVSIVFGIMSFTYTQTAGEAKVLVDFTGNVVGQDTDEGLAFKAPWVDTVDYNIRNQQAAFSIAGNTNGDTLGGEITVTDAKGVKANVDVVVRYSIKPDSVTDIYREFGEQINFEASLIAPDIRTVVRSVPAAYNTIEVLTKRPELEQAIYDSLATRWEKEGVIVDSVALQDIRYPESVVTAFAEAENARTLVTKEQANLAAAEVSAQQKVVQAEAEAEANRLISESLSPEVLQLRGYDALKHVADKGNLIVTDGSGTLLNVPAPAAK